MRGDRLRLQDILDACERAFMMTSLFRLRNF